MANASLPRARRAGSPSDTDDAMGPLPERPAGLESSPPHSLPASVPEPEGYARREDRARRN